MRKLRLDMISADRIGGGSTISVQSFIIEIFIRSGDIYRDIRQESGDIHHESEDQHQELWKMLIKGVEMSIKRVQIVIKRVGIFNKSGRQEGGDQGSGNVYQESADSHQESGDIQQESGHQEGGDILQEVWRYSWRYSSRVRDIHQKIKSGYSSRE